MKRAREGSDDGARKKPGNGAGYVHAFPRPAGPVPSSRSIHFCVTVPFCSYLFLPAPPPAAPPQCQPSLTSRSFHSSNYDSQSRGPKLKVEDALAYLAKVSPILLFPFWPICIARLPACCLRWHQCHICACCGAWQPTWPHGHGCNRSAHGNCGKLMFWHALSPSFLISVYKYGHLSLFLSPLSLGQNGVRGRQERSHLQPVLRHHEELQGPRVRCALFPRRWPVVPSAFTSPGFDVVCVRVCACA